MKRFLAMMLLMGLMCGLAQAADKPTTRQVITKLSDDMEKVWRDYGSDKQKDTRDRALQDLQTLFTKDIASATVTPNLKMQGVIKALLDNMEDSRVTFRVEKMVTTRNQFQQACVVAFKREFPKATDYTDARTTQKVFELMMDWQEQARDALRNVNSEGQTLTIQAINEVANGLLTGATIPENEDFIAQLDKNLKECRRRFPTSSEALKKVNQPILQTLETRAKDIQQKNLKGKK